MAGLMRSNRIHYRVQLTRTTLFLLHLLFSRPTIIIAILVSPSAVWYTSCRGII